MGCRGSADPLHGVLVVSIRLPIVSDLRFAIKSLRGSPGFTFIAIITLALGIGASTSSFSMLNVVLLRPLPYPDSGQLDRIYRSTPQDPRGGFSPADYLDLEPEMAGYGEIAAYAVSEMTLSGPGEPAEMTRGLRVSANLFSTLRTEPLLGRSFRPEETIPGNHRVLVIGHRYWQDRFGGDAGILGRTVRLDGEEYSIVGVLPAAVDDWRHLGPFDLFRPLAFDEKEKRDRSSTSIRLLGRRSPDLTRAEARAFITGFGRRLATEFPDANAGSTWRTMPFNLAVAPDNGPGLLGMVIGLSVLVLLIACSNLANLLLARTMARAREFALRAALGASRARLLRPLFVEALLLAFAGGVGGIQIARWFHAWIAVRTAGDFREGVSVVATLDWRVLGWAFGACLFTAVAFGVAPALFALRLDLNRTLKNGARGTTGDRGHQHFRQFLIVSQVALAMVLLAGAALFMRGLHDLNHSDGDDGWESRHLVSGTMLLPQTKYPDATKIIDFERLALQRLEALPGVESASISFAMPFFGLAEPRKIAVADREPPEPGHEPVAVMNGVSPGYFETVGTPLLSGRAFNDGDTPDSPRVFIINQGMARGLFGDESPIGRRIARVGGEALEWGEIVGVAGDVKSIYPDQVAVAYQFYQPLAQEPRLSSEIAVRTAPGTSPSAVVEDIRLTMSGLDPDVPLTRLQPAEATIARANNQVDLLGSVLFVLALLGLGLASLGIYGVIARTVVQRTSEFGIRLALGAQMRDILRLVLASGATLALLGSGIGLIGAFGISRLIAALFPAMQTNSGLILGGVTLLLIAVALLACYLPARNASRISPTEALRAE